MHLIFIVLYPLLHLWQNNPGEILFTQVLFHWGFFMILGLGLWGILRLAGIHRTTAGLSISLLIFTAINFHRFPQWWIFYRPLHQNLFYGTLYILVPLLLLYGFLLKWPQRRASLSRLFNFVSVALCLVVGFSLLAKQKGGPQKDLQAEQQPIKGSLESSLHPPPSIYHIVLDGYAHSDTLKTVYDYDNSSFISFLSESGFYVAPKSRSNYPNTAQSLSSMLNLNYLDQFRFKHWEGNTQDHPKLISLIRNSQVHQSLRAMGYQIRHFGSGPLFKATSKNPYADIVTHTSYFDELSMTLFNQSFFEPFLKVVIAKAIRSATLNNLEQLNQLPNKAGPWFNFIHIIPPHPPFVFDENGEAVPDVEVLWQKEAWTRKKKYLSQLKFITSRIREVLADLLRRVGPHAIVIVQSDHGPASYWRGDFVSHHKPGTPKFIEAREERTKILNAIYAPKIKDSGVYQTMTPVNTYRVLLNHLFEGSYSRLPDVVYFEGTQLTLPKKEGASRIATMEPIEGQLRASLN